MLKTLSLDPRQMALAGFSCVALVAAAPSAVRADGGQSVAAATPVVLNQLQEGNTANGGQSPGGCNSSDRPVYRSWWRIDARAKDRLTIKWSLQNPDNGIVLFPPGTDDFSFRETDYLVWDGASSQTTGQFEHRVNVTGSMPLEFYADTGCSDPPGPYSFTARLERPKRVCKWKTVKKNGKKTKKRVCTTKYVLVY